jgi:hypothetical protein
MSHEDILRRDPEMESALKDLQSGKISPQEWDNIVNQRKPVELYSKENIPKPATQEAAIAALDAGKKQGYGKADEYYKDGDPVKLRLDIPAYTRKENNAWVNAIHGKSPTAYSSASAVTNPKFSVTEDKAFKTAIGGGKSPYATIDGGYKSIKPEEAYKQAQKIHDDPAWVQVGMDPTRHSFFYTRGKEMRPVVGGEEALQIGPLVYVKNPRYGDRSKFKFASGGSVDHALELARKAIGY